LLAIPAEAIWLDRRPTGVLTNPVFGETRIDIA